MALVLSRVEYGEADLIVQLFTESLGRVSALARGARKSQRRFACLEPFHTLKLSLSGRPTSELMSLREASLLRPRLGIASRIATMESAARGLSWLRGISQPKSPEPELFSRAELFLDQLLGEPGRADEHLGRFGLGLLTTLGWGLDFERCVSCGKECPPEQAALVHPARGGLVCRACGGGPLRISPSERLFLRRASLEDATTEPLDASSDPRAILDIVERALLSHTGVGAR